MIRPNPEFLKEGADIELVRQGIGSDPRIGYSFLYAGTGNKGSCFPKDVQALTRTAREHGQNLAGKTFALWGLAFKPNTDDMRDAPSRVIIQALLRAGARIHAHDPVAAEEARRKSPRLLERRPRRECLHAQNLHYADKPMQAVQGADALIIVTEWKAYRSPNWTAMKAAMKTPVIFDGRNLYEPQNLQEAGIDYIAIGRGNHG